MADTNFKSKIKMEVSLLEDMKSLSDFDSIKDKLLYLGDALVFILSMFIITIIITITILKKN